MIQCAHKRRHLFFLNLLPKGLLSINYKSELNLTLSCTQRTQGPARLVIHGSFGKSTCFLTDLRISHKLWTFSLQSMMKLPEIYWLGDQWTRSKIHHAFSNFIKLKKLTYPHQSTFKSCLSFYTLTFKSLNFYQVFFALVFINLVMVCKSIVGIINY